MKKWPYVFIFLIWFIFSSPYFLKGKVPFPSTYLVTFFTPWAQTFSGPVKNNAMPDVITQIYPWKRVTIDSWKQGQIPLWNPYSFAGSQHAGNYQSAVFSPINFLFFILPEIDAWGVMILLQPLLAGLFMMMFLRSLKISDAAGVLGSIAFMFCGFNVVWMAYGTLGYAVLFLPLALFAINAQKKYLMSIAMTLSFLSGHLQMSLYVLGFVVCYIVYKKQFSYFKFVALGLMLAAPQILTALSAFMASGRSVGVSRGEIIPWQYLITVFAPDFYGNAVTRNDWFGHYAEWASFIGVIPLALAILVIFKKFNDQNVRFFTLAGIIALLFAVPSPLNSLLYFLKIPVLSNSAASRIIILFSFSFCVLAAYGLYYLNEFWVTKKIKILYLTTPVFLIWFWLLIVHPFASDKIQIAVRNFIFPTGLFILTLSLLIGGFYIPRKFQKILIIIFLFIGSFDLLRFASKWMPFDSRELVYPKTPVVEKLQQLTKDSHARVFGNIGNEVGSAFGLSLLEGYDALYQKRYGEFISSITNGSSQSLNRSVVQFDKHGIYSEKVLELLGAKYYVHKKSDGRFPWAYPVWEYPNYRLVWEDDNFQIFENTAALPRTFLAFSYKVVTNDQDILQAVLEFKNDIVLEKEPDINPLDGKGEAEFLTYSPNKVIIKTTSESPKLLFLSDVYDKGWRVTVDGKKSELLRADYDFRAVALQTGEHVIVMTYIPLSVQIGLALALFATIYILYENRIL